MNEVKALREAWAADGRGIEDSERGRGGIGKNGIRFGTVGSEITFDEREELENVRGLK